MHLCSKNSISCLCCVEIFAIILWGLCWGPSTEDYLIWGSILRSRILGNCHISGILGPPANLQLARPDTCICSNVPSCYDVRRCQANNSRDPELNGYAFGYVGADSPNISSLPTTLDTAHQRLISYKRSCLQKLLETQTHVECRPFGLSFSDFGLLCYLLLGPR